MRTTDRILYTLLIYPDNWSTRDLARVLNLTSRDLAGRLRQMEKCNKVTRTSHATRGRFGRSATWALDETFVRTSPVLSVVNRGRRTTGSRHIKKQGLSGRNSGRTERNKKSPTNYTLQDPR